MHAAPLTASNHNTEDSIQTRYRNAIFQHTALIPSCFSHFLPQAQPGTLKQ